LLIPSISTAGASDKAVDPQVRRGSSGFEAMKFSLRAGRDGFEERSHTPVRRAPQTPDRPAQQKDPLPQYLQALSAM
jgi:hypothetical protein